MIEYLLSFKKFINLKGGYKYIVSLITQFLVLVCLIILYKLIAYNFGKVSFEDFSFYKRVSTFLLAILGLGLYTSIIRNISREEKYQFEILFFLFIFISLFNIVFECLFYILYPYFGIFLQNYISDVKEGFSLVYIFIGFYFHNVTYAFLRGINKHCLASFFDLINKGLLPIVLVDITNSLKNFILYTGLFQIIISVIVFFYLRLKIYKIDNLVLTIKVFSKFVYIIKFGIKRVPSDLGMNILFLLPIFFANHQAGKVSFLITLLLITGYFFIPINSIIFPKLSYYFKLNNIKIIKNYLKIIFFIVISISFIYTFFYSFFQKEILIFFLGNKYSKDDIILFKFLSFLFFPYSIIIMGKIVIDAFFERGVMSYILLLQILCFFISIFFLKKFFLYYYIVAFLISLYFGCFLILFFIYLILKKINENI